jgi:hypothetical protein
VIDAATTLTLVEWRRVAYRMDPAVLRACIPAGVPGTYVLLHGANPIYVGRSDTCTLRRLCTHEHATNATHVTWEPSTSPQRAFWLEAAAFHTLCSSAQLLNQRHPAKPTGYSKDCPFCGAGVDRALGIALSKRSAISAVAVDREGSCCENL